MNRNAALSLCITCTVYIMCTVSAPLYAADCVPPKITVRGQAEIQVPADSARFNAAVVTTNRDATEALDENNRRVEQVIDALEQAGIEDTQIETGRFNLLPVFAPRPPRAEPGWQPEIVGFTVRNQVLVRTRHPTALGELITAANNAGANAIDNLTFDLHDPTPYRGQAITEATRNALADAKVAADAAHVKLGGIVAIDVERAPSVRPIQATALMSMAAERTPVPVQPGQVSVHAFVTVTLEIAP